MADEAQSLRGGVNAAGGEHEETRRDFLMLVAGAVGAVATVATAYVVVDSMAPAGDVLAAGGPVEVDLSKVAPGQQVVVLWRGRPILSSTAPRLC